MKKSKIKTAIASVPVPSKCGHDLYAVAFHIGKDEGILISNEIDSLHRLWDKLNFGTLNTTEIKKVSIFNQKDVVNEN
ncbi:MAG: hypothetical protein LLG05_09815 [Porphyromonadaceae bacterium]|nr:hypothetical protein [Porphyromonadaceae bacterium]